MRKRVLHTGSRSGISSGSAGGLEVSGGMLLDGDGRGGEKVGMK